MKIDMDEILEKNPLRQKKITICLSYYNQGKEILLKHINEWKRYPQKDKFSFFIIDDCSKIPIKKILKDINLSDLDIHIYRVEEDLSWNIAGVRNLGAKECKTEWMMIIDMDTLLPKELSNEIINLTKEKTSLRERIKRLENKKIMVYNFGMIRSKKEKRHPAVCLIKKEDYWEIGGCDEDLVGHYGKTDETFWHRGIGKIDRIFMEELLLKEISEAQVHGLDRNTEHNQKLFVEKIKTNKWSTDYIRFKWKKVIM